MLNIYYRQKTELNFSILGANNRVFIVHIIVSRAQINHITREYSGHSQQSNLVLLERTLN